MSAPHDHPAPAGHEPDDLNVRTVLLFAAGLFALAVAVHFALAAVMGGFAAERKRSSVPPPEFADDAGQYAGPRLQIDPTRDLKAMRDEENARLTSYEWVDPKGRVARIPIDRAMEIIAKKGLPVRDARKSKEEKR